MGTKHFPFLAGLMVAFFPHQVNAANEIPWLRTSSDCTQLNAPGAIQICERVTRAREILEPLHPKLIPNKHGRAMEREIMLVVWDEKTDTPHTITLSTQFRLSKKEEPKIVVKTPGYHVERVRGTGLYKLQFLVTKSGVELPVYGGKHLWVPDGSRSEWSHEKLTQVTEERQYLPFQDHLYHRELVEFGKEYLEKRITDARNELRSIPSRAFPTQTLYEMYPTEVVLNVIVSEHSDPYLVFGKRKFSKLTDAEYFLGTLVEFALHGPNTFADLCSSAHACGWTQFTNTPKHHKDGTFWPGTYSYTYRECRKQNGDPVIDREFVRGTRDTHNAIKAAICYLDLEKMALPALAREEFLRDPKRGSAYALTAYNAGSPWSRRLFEKMQKIGAQFVEGFMPFSHDTIPRSLFENGTFYNEEPHLYVRKYLWLWELLYPNRNIVVPVAIGR